MKETKRSRIYICSSELALYIDYVVLEQAGSPARKHTYT